MDLATCRRLLRRTPELVHFFSDEALEVVISQRSCTPRLEELAAAELLIRDCLSPSTEGQYAALLAGRGLIRDEALMNFARWLKECESTPRLDFPETLPRNGPWALVVLWLGIWREAEGAVLLAPTRIGILTAAAVPFRAETRHDGEPRLVNDQGQGLTEIATPLEDLTEGTILQHRKVRLFFVPGPEQLSLSGSSAGLALAVALSKEHYSGSRGPLFGALLSVALRNGVTDSVEGAEQKREAARRLGCRFLALPDGSLPDSSEESQPAILTIPRGLSARKAIDRVLQELRSEKLWTAPRDQDIESRLKDLRCQLRLGDCLAIEALEQAHALRTALNGRDDEFADRLRLYIDSVEVAAHCHRGNTNESHQVLQQCLSRAEKRKSWSLFFEARAFDIVGLTDLGLYDDARSQGRELLERINRLSEYIETRDLLEAKMRAYGSLGQTLMFAALRNRECREEGLAMLRYALEAARELHFGETPSEDICRDLNYIAFWHALHDTENTAASFEEARSAIESARDANSEAHLRRITLLAQYRLALHGREPGVIGELPDKEGREPWIRGIACKYLGALKAREHRFDEAEKLLEEGWNLLKGPPLIAFLGATLAIEAVRTFERTKAHAAAVFRTRARQRLHSSASRLPKALVEPWSNFLENPRSVANPQLTYMY